VARPRTTPPSGCTVWGAKALPSKMSSRYSTPLAPTIRSNAHYGGQLHLAELSPRHAEQGRRAAYRDASPPL
jgi:hypothetical protein